MEEREQRVINRIATLESVEFLQAIIDAAKERLGELEKPKGIVRLVCKENVWFAVISDRNGQKQKTVNLGKRLTAVQVIARSKQKAPSVEDFEIDQETAVSLRNTDQRQTVGWWEIKNKQGLVIGKRYYNVPKYNQARDKWHNWQQLANDPVSMAHGVSVEGMQKLKQLERDGHTIVIDESGH